MARRVNPLRQDPAHVPPRTAARCNARYPEQRRHPDRQRRVGL